MSNEKKVLPLTTLGGQMKVIPAFSGDLQEASLSI